MKISIVTTFSHKSIYKLQTLYTCKAENRKVTVKERKSLEDTRRYVQ